MNAAKSIREYIPTVIIGGGQAALTMAYHLKRAGEPSLVLEASARVGDSWRHRWDSLRLFSFPKYASLPGWPMPLKSFPSHDEMADYLEDYARHFQLPVRTCTWVQQLSPNRLGFLISTPTGDLQADRIVVCTGAYQKPFTPAIAAQIDPTIRQLHSSDYRNPSQLDGAVLVVGAGNSGAEIALEAARSGHPTWLSGRHPGQIPFRIETRRAKLAVPVVMFVFRRVLTVNTPMGRRAHANLNGHATPLVRTKRADLEAAGVTAMPRIEDTNRGRPVTSDGNVLNPQTIVWCTGYRDDFAWIDLPGAIDAAGHPVHDRGASPIPGLYFLGLEFQFAVASATIQGLDQDARYLMQRLRPLIKASRSRTDADLAVSSTIQR
jgi:putative flavoprotein involved in K+ transport